jgi:hypothetical protein
MGRIFYWVRITLLHPFLLIGFYRTKFQHTAFQSATLADVFIKYGGSRYGGSAHHGYILAGYAMELSHWEQAIPRLLKDIPNVNTFANYIQTGIAHTSERILKDSSQLISICPDDKRMPEIVLVSKHIAFILYKAVLSLDYQKFWKYFNQFWRISQSHGAAGWLWEAHAIHRVLCGSDDPLSHPLRALTQAHTGSLVVELPFRDVQEHGNAEDLAKHLARIVPSMHDGSNYLFIPGAKNQATFSISAGQNVSLFQITTTRGTHSVKATGLDFLWDAVSEAKELTTSPLVASLLPTTARKWRLIFVVPRRIAHHWKKPQDIDFGGVKQKRAWNDYIEQSVMVLEDGTAEITEITEPSLGKRGQDGHVEVTLKPAKAAHIEMDDEAEEADLPNNEGKKKAASPRLKKKQKSRQIAGGSRRQ